MYNSIQIPLTYNRVAALGTQAVGREEAFALATSVIRQENILLNHVYKSQRGC